MFFLYNAMFLKPFYNIQFVLGIFYVISNKSNLLPWQPSSQRRFSFRATNEEACWLRYVWEKCPFAMNANAALLCGTLAGGHTPYAAQFLEVQVSGVFIKKISRGRVGI